MRAPWRGRPSSSRSNGTRLTRRNWQNDVDVGGDAAGGGVTALAIGRTEAGRTCREVLVETAMERRPTAQRVRTYFRDDSEWRKVALGRQEEDAKK